MLFDLNCTSYYINCHFITFFLYNFVRLSPNNKSASFFLVQYIYITTTSAIFRAIPIAASITFSFSIIQPYIKPSKNNCLLRNHLKYTLSFISPSPLSTSNSSAFDIRRPVIFISVPDKSAAIRLFISLYVSR